MSLSNRTYEPSSISSGNFIMSESNDKLRDSSRFFMRRSRWQPDSSRLKFQKLADKWHNETIIMSLERDVVLHPAYQEIIGMGPSALPFILSELEKRPALWFWALRAITGLNPVKGSEDGNVEAMRSSWLCWAYKNNQLSSRVPSEVQTNFAYA